MRLRLAEVSPPPALPCAAPAGADTTTVLGPPDRSPVVIAGSSVRPGDRLTSGQVLVRRVVTVAQGGRRTIRIACPAGPLHAGLGLFDQARVGFVARNRYPGHH